jgi:hypothetical protein
MNEREKRLLEFLAERYKAWSAAKYVTGDPSFGQGYDMAKVGCADDIDDFMSKEYPEEWAQS